MPPVKGTKKNGFFTRDENVLPFFSWHEKTKLGTILRIALVAFMAFTVIISLVARYAHITLSSASSFLPMTYAIPLAIVFALVVLALFKRMRSTFSRVTVGLAAAMVVLLAISILSSYLNLMPLLLLSQNEVSLPKKYAGLQVKGRTTSRTSSSCTSTAAPTAPMKERRRPARTISCAPTGWTRSRSPYRPQTTRS